MISLKYTKKKLLESLKELSLSLGRYPTTKEINNSKITPNSDTYYKHFKKIKGILIRIKDEGRKDKNFVEEKVGLVSKLLEKKLPTEKVIHL